MSCKRFISSRAAAGLVRAGVLSLTTLLALSPGRASAGAHEGDEPTPKDTAIDMSTVAPQGDLELTRAQRVRLDTAVERTLSNSRPGGVRVAPDTIVWKDRGVVMTFPVNGKTREVSSGTGPMADGRVKLYDGYQFNGRRLSFYYCNFEKLRWYDFTNKTSSWVNSQYDHDWTSLYYWTGSKVKYLDGKFAVSSVVYLPGNLKNNRTDFVEVC